MALFYPELPPALPPIRRFRAHEIAEWAGDAEHIVLDFGKVLIDIEPRLSAESFISLGARPSFSVGEIGYKKHNAYHAVETDALSPAEFRQAFRAHLRYSAPDESLDAAWNALLLEFQPWLLGQLRDLGQRYRLHILSNTNRIHIDEVKRRMGLRAYGEFSRCFENVFYSYDLKLRKPDIAIYQTVDRIVGVKDPARVFFLDDNADNIEAALQHGWKAKQFI
ncbi:HAD family phosphatase [Schleiferiaceae bacterium]|nr:HAD family phosphatase [Schleiferiaceae bacterium]